MIEKFSITNHLSIRDTITIDFRPKLRNDDRDYEDLFIQPNNNTKLLKAAFLYGANASGKTNVIESCNVLKGIVTDNTRNRNDETGFVPFLFDNTCCNSPGSFELEFFVSGIKYIYAVTLDNNTIHTESLSYYPSRNPALVYSRKQGERIEISFGSTMDISKYERDVIAGNCLPNTSVIAAVGKTSIENKILNGVYHYFSKTFLDIITPETDLLGWAINYFESLSEHRQRTYLELLQEADFQIEKIDIISRDLDEESVNRLISNGYPKAVIEKLKNRKKLKVKTLNFWHRYADEMKSLNIQNESSGTRRFFGLAGVLDKMIFSSCFLAVDELENSIHPDLLNHFLLAFFMNTKQSQIICSTHDQRLMESDFARRDMLWFCEKDSSVGSTSIARGSDYGIHKNNSIANFYKIGKLGAVPETGSVLIHNPHNECDNG